MADDKQPLNPAPPPYSSGGGYPPPQSGYPPPQSGYPPPQSGYPPPQSGYPPPQPGYQQQYQGGSHTATVTAVVTQPAVVHQKLGEHPVTVTCPTGGHQVTTKLHYEAGTLTWVVAAVLFFIVGICFAWIPFVINDLKDVVHTCPIDGTVIGVYRRM